MRPLANAPVSWGVFTTETAPLGWARYLDEVAAAGYAGTELGPYGFMPETPDALREALAVRGLALEGAVHVHDFTGPDADFFSAVETTGRLLAAAGARHLVVMGGGQAHAPAGHTPENWRRMVRTLEGAATRAADLGLTLSVHPHVLTFIERLHEVEQLLSDSNLCLCFDTGHHAFWGDDPACFLTVAWDRIAYVHLKNVDADLCGAVREGRLDVRAALDRGAFCPLDEGSVDIPAIVALLKAREFAGPVVVEQDWAGGEGTSAADLAARNLQYLSGVMG